MRAGELNSLVSIKQRVSTQDDIGQPVETWNEVTKAWAGIFYKSGFEAVKSGADVSTLKCNIRIRYTQVTITAGMRIDYGSTVFDIEAVLPDAKRRHIDMVCKVIK